MTPIFRFAPSPTGFLHLGHALSAACVWRAARQAGGDVLLRIEDIDPIRAKPEFAAAIEEDLDWLGFEWSGDVRRQSERLDDHRAALDRLDERGLLYRSRLSRSDIMSAVARAGAWPRDPDGAPRIPIAGARETDDLNPPAMRLDMASALAKAGADAICWTEEGEGPNGETGTVAARPQEWGDVVLARKDVPTSYHLAVVVDDALQGVTHVVRGQDLFYATSVHRLLQRLLGLPEPIYRHHRLLVDVAGRKLAKSRDSLSLRALRAAGWTRDDVFRVIGRTAEP